MGPHTVDCFASAHLTQLEHFNSRFAELGSEMADTFTTDWGEENNWCCPLLCLVPRMIQAEFGCQTGHKVFAPYGAGPHLGGGVFGPICPMLLLGGWAGFGWHLWLLV